MITVTALFTQSTGEPATGLALVDIDLYLYRRAKATGVVSTVWTAQNPKKTYPDTQVIILTGHGTDKEEAEAVRLGGFGFLKKPTDIETLEHAILTAFKEKAAKTR